MSSEVLSEGEALLGAWLESDHGDEDIDDEGGTIRDWFGYAEEARQDLERRITELAEERELLRAKVMYLESRVKWNAGEVDRLTARYQDLEQASRDLERFMPSGYAGIPLANFRHAVEALSVS
jgi:chromosome segregation ATPase